MGVRRGVLAGILVLAACTAPAPEPSPAPTPAPTEPLVLAVHHTRPSSDVPLGVAEGLPASARIAGTNVGQSDDTLTVVQPEPGDNPLATVHRDRDTLALVPATDIDGSVTVLTVDGVDPLLNPDDYPLRIEAATNVSPTVTTVTIVGDIMLGRRVGQAIVDDPEAPFRDFAERLGATDITVGNFESTLSDDGAPTQGGDSFAADPAVLAGLELAGFDAVSLANNHLGDFGRRAMLDTFDEFHAAGIATFGAGRDLDEAREAWITTHDGVRIAFLGTESIGETPGATADQPGTNRLNMPPRTGPLDRAALDRINADIAGVARDVDTVIVLPHWGTQYTHVPEKIQRDVAVHFATSGADLIVGGHPHWVQGWETIGDTVVVHSLGNFIFDMEFSRQVQEGVFVEIVLWDGQVKAIQPVPYVIENHFPRPARHAEAASILDDMRSTSRGPYAD